MLRLYRRNKLKFVNLTKEYFFFFQFAFYLKYYSVDCDTKRRGAKYNFVTFENIRGLNIRYLKMIEKKNGRTHFFSAYLPR
jgi:hypothetical protein